LDDFQNSVLVSGYSVIKCQVPNIFMCETLDEIHSAQMAMVIARLRKQKAQPEEQQFLICSA